MLHTANWIEESTPDESIAIITHLALMHARKGGPQGERIAASIASGDILSVCNTRFDYADGTAYELYNCRQAVAFFSKAPFLDLGIDRRETALTKWRESEEACKLTNELFQLRANGRIQFSPISERIISIARSKIARVLGPVPKFSELKLRHGPGATTLTKKRNATPTVKFGDGISCSEDLAPYAARLLEEVPHFSALHETSGIYSRLADRLECVLVGVRITNDILNFAPKNAMTHRVTMTGGSLNLMVQLAFGDHMSRRLLAFGVDLKDQGRNQSYAFEGSMSGEYATLDLSSASDTISTEVVFELLPIDWALALNVCRSKKVDIDGVTVEQEKFASMGNGFTFPLESLIFWALSSAAAPDGFASVYGDDIIVRTDSVQPVIDILALFGFTLNKEKSFWSGSFRESCGADYIRGIDVRPFYQKDLISPASLFRLHNYYVRRGEEEMADHVKTLINPALHLYGPDGFGDGHLLGGWVPKRHKKSLSHGYGGVIFDTYRLSGLRDKRALRPGDRVLPSYSIYIREDGDTYIPDTAMRGPHGVFLRRFQGKYAPEPIPERVSQVDGSHIKCPGLPGTDGYKRISIYTLAH